MLSRENNERMCLVEGDAPAGRMFRSIWLPAIPSVQLGAFGDPPGPPAAAGRGPAGVPGTARASRASSTHSARIAARRCSSAGRKMPDCAAPITAGCSIAPASARKSPAIPPAACARTCSCAPTRLRKRPASSGSIWAATRRRPCPHFRGSTCPQAGLRVSVWLQESNWFQGAEGEIDSSHVSILHKDTKSNATGGAHQKWTFLDPSPKLFIEPTEIDSCRWPAGWRRTGSTGASRNGWRRCFP